VPYLIGKIWQGGTLSIIFAISASEAELKEHASIEQLSNLVKQLEVHQRYFGVKRVATAGILPSLLRARRLEHKGIEVEVTCNAVANAVQKIITSIDREFEKSLFSAEGVTSGAAWLARLSLDSKFCL
jgi:hypothetical protein